MKETKHAQFCQEPIRVQKFSERYGFRYTHTVGPCNSPSTRLVEFLRKDGVVWRKRWCCGTHARKYVNSPQCRIILQTPPPGPVSWDQKYWNSAAGRRQKQWDMTTCRCY